MEGKANHGIVVGACLDPIASRHGVVDRCGPDWLRINVDGGQWQRVELDMCDGAVDARIGERVRLEEYDGGRARLVRIRDE